MKVRAGLLLLMLILALTAFGQSNSPPQSVSDKLVLTGTVYDSNGSVIVSSQVVARSLRGRDYQAKTTAEGVYKLELPIDVYRIEANASGFCPRRLDQVRVGNPNWNQTLLNFNLEVATAQRPCKQKTMIKKERPTRQPDIFRSIAE